MPQPVLITLMMRTFLYLPLYVAEGLKLFKKHVPHEYDVRLERRSQEQTDVEVYERVMGEKSGDEHIWFGVCDPMPVYNFRQTFHQGRKAKVVAALIDKATFWAVNHEATINHYYDLSTVFEKIIAFKKGTTSNILAQEVAIKPNNGAAPTSIAIESVEPGNELKRLLGTNTEKTFAITPDLLSAINYLDSHNLKICYAFSGSGMFSKLLVTALITREDIIWSHPRLIKGILLALEEAFALIKLKDPEVLKLGPDLFNCEANTFRKTLESALEEDLFPSDMRVERDSWQNAVRIFHKSQGQAEPTPKQLDDTLEQCVDRKLTREVREQFVLPLIVGKNRKKTFLERMAYAAPPTIGFVTILIAGFTSNEATATLLKYCGLLLILGFVGKWLSDNWRLTKLPKLWQAVYILSWVIIFILLTMGYDAVAGKPIAAKILRSPALLEQVKNNFFTILLGVLGIIFLVIQLAGLHNPPDES